MNARAVITDFHRNATPGRMRALEGLAKLGEIGTCALPGDLNGGALSALCNFGWAERRPPIDDLGGLRYRITALGLAVLEPHRAAAVAKAKPAGFSTTMAHREAGPPGSDFFPTAPWGFRALGELIRRYDPQARTCWECACGAGHGVHGLQDYFDAVYASDLHDYTGNDVYDFTGHAVRPAHTEGVDWIVSNPPFDPAEAFVRRAWTMAGRGVAMLVRVGFLESLGRYRLLYRDCPYAVFAPFSERLPLLRGCWDPDASSAQFYCWVIWLKPCVRSPAARLAREARRVLSGALTVPIPPGTCDRLTRDSDAAFAVERS